MLARRAAAGPLERTHAAEGAHPGGRRRSAPPGHGRERFAPRRLRFSSIRGTTSTGALCPVPMASSDRSQSQPTRRQSLPSTESSRSAPHALRGGLRSHLRASLWASARSEGTMRFLTHALELVVPSDRAQTQRPCRESARRCFATARGSRVALAPTPTCFTSPVCLSLVPLPRLARRWLITYMMQMNPLIEPKPVAE